MSRLVIRLLEILLITTVASAVTTVRPVVIPGTDNDEGNCPSRNKREAAIQTVMTTINLHHLECRTGSWYSVTHLDMSDPSQQCPPAWREYNRSGVRACGRPTTSGGSCPATLYSTSRQYSRVCGRAIGYQIGSPDAFGYNAQGQTIDSYYVYGLSITHGTPHNHIWTYAAGITEGSSIYTARSNCPCIDPPSRRALPPSFVGDNYYCESGNPASSYMHNYLYYADPLWDGKKCEGECCSNGKFPPWFSVELTNSTIN